MAETSSTTKQSENQPNNPFVFLCNIPKFLLNALMNFTNNKQQNAENIESVKNVEEEETVVPLSNFTTPDVVRFPLVKHDVPPIKIEGDDIKDDTNPIILWQVYALGGYIILKWAWGKWQERQAKAKEDSPDEDDPPTEE
ncbi:uncharacterized protein LOC141646992 [Silene latifolia]|uniref:uncharacterized protein LOC141646992 n=1 Tax=Silene latifolia TaxID=37657 RepID=UPI003D775E1C